MLLNLDAGEHDDEPEELWALFDVLNVACGGHAGDDASMARVARFIAAHPPMRIGAHPSYPDRAGFGRTTLAIDPAALRASITEQCTRLDAIARRHGLAITSVKLHGALYHDANRDPQLAALALDAVTDALGTVAIVGPERGVWADAARARGFTYLREGFADRGRRADGTLVPRSEPGALITDPAAAAAQARMLEGSVDTLCLHSDTPGALTIARAVRGRARVNTWTQLGERALRFARPAGSARAIVDAVRAWPGVVDVVVSREDVAAYFDREPHVEPWLFDALTALRGDDADAREVVLRARYDGEDLANVAATTGLTVDEVVRRHAAATYTVDTIGFAPGFAYLTGLDRALVVPRRTTPRPRVPAGALAIAADRTAVYPFASPGGWHLIGNVDEPMFGPAGARLQLGDRVRFVR